MAIALVQSTTNSRISATTTSNTSTAFGVAPTAGNLVLGFIFVSGPRTVTKPSGWSGVNTDLANATAGWTLGMHYKVAGGSEPTTYSWTWVSAFVISNIWTAEFSGVDTVTPIDVADIWNDFGYSGGPDSAPAITTVTAGALDIVAHSTQDTNDYGPVAGYAELIDMQSLGLYTKTIAVAGSTGTRSVPHGTTSYTAGTSFALRPSGGGGGGTTAMPVFGRIYRPQLMRRKRVVY